MQISKSLSSALATIALPSIAVGIIILHIYLFYIGL